MVFPLTTGTVDEHGMNQEPTRTVLDNGTQQWRVAGQLHRLDGPAVIMADGTQQWRVADQLHRLDGPAWIGVDGTREWWVNHQDITHKIETWMSTQEVTWPWDDQTHMLFLLTWA